MTKVSPHALRALFRLGWRSIRKAPGRSLLVFLLITFVVAAGTFAAVTSRSTSASSDDFQLEEFGAANFRADLGTGQFGPYGPFDVPVPIPAPIPIGPDGVLLPGQIQTDEELQRQLDDAREWYANFDRIAFEDQIEAELGIDIALTRQSFLNQGGGPFGSVGTAISQLSDIDLSEPANRGRMTLVEGRLPAQAGEIAIAVRSGSQPGIGESVTVAGTDLTVVGTVTGAADRYSAPSIVTPVDFDQLIPSDSGIAIQVTAILAGGDRTAPQVASAIASLSDRSISVRTPTSIFTPRPNGWDRFDYSGDEWRTGTAAPRVVPILISGLLAVQIALVCAAAFAVGIRRRTKEFGQLMTLGADDRHIRRLAQAEAVLLGALAAVVGLATGVAASSIAVNQGWLDNVGSRLPTEVRWSIVDWFGPAAVGIVAVVLAAWWPTRVLSRAPIPGVLEGRLPAVAVRNATPKWGLLLVAGGAAALALGTNSLNGSGGGTGGFVLMLAGIVAMIGGAIFLIGTLLSLMGRRADRFPLLARLAVRNSDRQRSRSWVVVGAFIAALAIPVVLGAATKTYPNSFGAADQSLYTGRLVTSQQIDVSGRSTTGIPQIDPDLVALDADLGSQIRQAHDMVGEVELVTSDRVGITFFDNGGGYGGGLLVAATDDFIELFDLSPEIVAAVRDGKAVDVAAVEDPWQQGDPYVSAYGVGATTERPIEVVDGPPIFSYSTWLVDPEAVLPGSADLWAATGTVRLLAEPLTVAQEDAIRQTGNELYFERFGEFNSPFNSTAPNAWINFSVERNHTGGPSASTVQLWAFLASVALALLVALVTSALSAVEMTNEIESMIATGAAPSIRRRLLGAQTLYHLVIAALLAIPLGLIAFWAVVSSDDYRARTDLVIPWFSMATVLVAIPVVVALVIAATFRNGKPAISRRLS